MFDLHEILSVELKLEERQNVEVFALGLVQTEMRSTWINSITTGQCHCHR